MSYFFDNAGVYPNNAVFYNDMLIRPESIVVGPGSLNMVDPTDVNPFRLGSIKQSAGGTSLIYTDSNGVQHVIGGSGSADNATFIVKVPDVSVPNAQAIVNMVDNNGGGASKWKLIGVKDNVTGEAFLPSIIIDTAGTAADNLFVGLGAGNTSLTTANQNIAMGNRALELLTTANGNVGIGALSLSNVTSGNGGNIGVGAATGRDITAGVANTCIGFSAGSQTTTGSFNICLGQQAEVGLNATGCIAIGFNSQVALLGALVDSVAIGRGCTVSQNNSCNFGAADGMSIGVNQPNPITVLDLSPATGKPAALSMQTMNIAGVPPPHINGGILSVDTNDLYFTNTPDGARLVPFNYSELQDVQLTVLAPQEEDRIQWDTGLNKWTNWAPARGSYIWQPASIGAAGPIFKWTNTGGTIPTDPVAINEIVPTVFNVTQVEPVDFNYHILQVQANGKDATEYIGGIFKVSLSANIRVSTFPADGNAGFQFHDSNNDAVGSSVQGTPQRVLFWNRNQGISSTSISMTGYTIGRDVGGTVCLVDLWGISDGITADASIEFDELQISWERVA